VHLPMQRSKHVPQQSHCTRLRTLVGCGCTSRRTLPAPVPHTGPRCRTGAPRWLHPGTQRTQPHNTLHPKPMWHISSRPGPAPLSRAGPCSPFPPPATRTVCPCQPCMGSQRAQHSCCRRGCCCCCCRCCLPITNSTHAPAHGRTPSHRIQHRHMGSAQLPAAS
jgi:hypothetical protein